MHIENKPSFKKLSLYNPFAWLTFLIIPFVIAIITGVVALVFTLVKLVENIGGILKATASGFYDGLVLDYELMTGKDLKPKGSPENED